MAIANLSIYYTFDLPGGSYNIPAIQNYISSI